MGKTLTEEIMELRQMKLPELLTRYEALFGKPPRTKHRAWLWKRIAWKVQERRFGGLSEVAKRRLEELISEIDLPLGKRERSVTGAPCGDSGAAEHKVGTVFTRTWRGREVHARRVEGGYESEGVHYRSLSALAKAITGSHWNGRLFFGLTRRTRGHG